MFLKLRTIPDLSCRGEGDLDLNLLGGDLICLSCRLGLIGPSLSVMGGGEERNLLGGGPLSSPGGGGGGDLRRSSLNFVSGSLIGVVESASGLAVSSSSLLSSFSSCQMTKLNTIHAISCEIAS